MATIEIKSVEVLSSRVLWSWESSELCLGKDKKYPEAVTLESPVHVFKLEHSTVFLSISFSHLHVRWRGVCPKRFYWVGFFTLTHPPDPLESIRFLAEGWKVRSCWILENHLPDNNSDWLLFFLLRFVDCKECGRKMHQICVLHYDIIWPSG